jgi:hypothetical protein
MDPGVLEPGGIRSASRSNNDSEDGRALLKTRLKSVNEKQKRTVIGIETGNSRGKLGAAVVEVAGMGDDTILYLRGFIDYDLPPELVEAPSIMTFPLSSWRHSTLSRLGGISIPRRRPASISSCSIISRISSRTCSTRQSCRSMR